MESFEILPSPDSEAGVYQHNLAASSTTSSEGRLYYKEFSADDLTEDSHGLTRSYPKPIDTLPPPMSSRGQSLEHQPTHIPVDEEGYSRRTSALDYSPAESPVLPSLFEGYPSGLPTSDSSSFNYDRPDPTLQDVPRSTPTYHDPEVSTSQCWLSTRLHTTRLVFPLQFLYIILIQRKDLLGDTHIIHGLIIIRFVLGVALSTWFNRSFHCCFS